jgi:hypothetical protein
MNELPAPTAGELVVLHSPPREVMSMIVARLALSGPVCVLDTGNRYDAYGVARLVRRQTVELETVLNRIHIARAFTCYQVVALFDVLPDAAAPHVIFELTSTFEDENVRFGESQRLLSRVLEHVQRLRQSAPVIVSLRPPHQNQRRGLLRVVTALADHVFTWETTPFISQPTLF